MVDGAVCRYVTQMLLDAPRSSVVLHHPQVLGVVRRPALHPGTTCVEQLPSYPTNLVGGQDMQIVEH